MWLQIPNGSIKFATTVCATKTLGQADRAAAAQGINGVGVIAKRGEDFAAEFADQRRMEQGAAFARGAMPGMLGIGENLPRAGEARSRRSGSFQLGMF